MFRNSLITLSREEAVHNTSISIMAKRLDCESEGLHFKHLLCYKLYGRLSNPFFLHFILPAVV